MKYEMFMFAWKLCAVVVCAQLAAPTFGRAVANAEIAYFAAMNAQEAGQ